MVAQKASSRRRTAQWPVRESSVAWRQAELKKIPSQKSARLTVSDERCIDRLNRRRFPSTVCCKVEGPTAIKTHIRMALHKYMLSQQLTCTGLVWTARDAGWAPRHTRGTVQPSFVNQRQSIKLKGRQEVLPADLSLTVFLCTQRCWRP